MYLSLHIRRAQSNRIRRATTTLLIVKRPPVVARVRSFVVIEGRLFRHVLYLLRSGSI